MMMQSEHLIHISWPIESYFHSDSDYYESEHHEIFSSINSTPENSMISSGLYGCGEYPVLGYDQMQDPSPVYSESQSIDTLDDVCRWLCDDYDDQEFETIKSIVSIDDVMEESNDVMEPEDQSGLQNLLKAYADGMSMGQIELAKVIVRCIGEKISPIGQTLERVSFNLFVENQEEYLKQESMRNFKMAFRVFYDIFPYGRFAHFTANSTILKMVPTHVELIHIVDFDLGEGSQWPHVIEAIAQMKKSLIITSIKKHDQDQDSQFDQTRWHLCNFARSFGLNLKVQEMEMGQLVKVIKGRKSGKEFLAFNCMVGLPHMGKTRTAKQVIDFLKAAKFVLAENKGIITFGDGEEGERMGGYSDFPSFFNKNLAHYKAFYESMEWGFPSYLNEARLAIETLFLAPFVSSKSWFGKWEEQRENNGFLKVPGLKGIKMSRESLNEARELVKEGESPYGIRIEGENGNEMVLEWSGIPLVKVSAWV